MQDRVNVFIPSYFGNSKVREARKVKHDAQLQWLLQSRRIEAIYIASQGYLSGEYFTDPRVHYIDVEQKNPARARNALLNRHDEVGGLAFFLDNDIFSVTPVDDILERCTSKHYDDWEMLGLTYIGKERPATVIPDELVFKRTSQGVATCGFLIKPQLGVRFDEDLNDLEDREFSYAMMLQHGGRQYQLANCNAWFCFVVYDKNSTIYSGVADRWPKWRAAMDYIYAKHADRIQELGGGDNRKAIKNLPWPSKIIL